MTEATATPVPTLSQFLFSLKGRVGRGQYWRSVAAFIAVAVLVGMLDTLLVMASKDAILVPIFALLTAYPCAAILAKRWHDRDKSGWWVLLSLIPVIGVIWTLIECGFLKGSDGPNRFGEAPEPEDA